MDNQQISVIIGGRTYRLAVPDGQDARLKHVASKVDRAVEELRAKAPNMDRDQLVVLAALQIADDMYSLEQQRDTEQKSIAAFHKSLAERLEKLAG